MALYSVFQPKRRKICGLCLPCRKHVINVVEMLSLSFFSLLVTLSFHEKKTVGFSDLRKL